MSDDGFSCTRQIQFSYSITYDMVIIDFPGLKSSEDVINYLRIQKKTLSMIPVKMICFVIEYFCRFDLIIKEISDMKSIFSNYIKNIAIIITKTENVDNNHKDKLKFAINKKFGIENILFSTKITNSYKLCEEFNNLKNRMENINNVEVKTKDIVKTLNYDSPPEIEKQREIYEKNFEEVLGIFQTELNKAKDNELKRAIYFCFRDYKGLLLQDFINTVKKIKINGEEPDYDILAAEVLILDNRIMNGFNDFRKQIEKELDIQINNYNGEFNRFKKCPHCGLIWFKVKGCNSVVCGKRTRIRDKFFGRFKEYKVSFKDKKFTIEKVNELGDNNFGFDLEFFGLTEEEKKENEERKLKRKVMIKPVGCGNNLRWDEMEDCSKEVIQKLKESSLEDDYFSQSIGFYENEKNFKK